FGILYNEFTIYRTKTPETEVYILERSKIIVKLRESGLGDIEEFSDIPQDDLPENETTDIPIFNVLEIIPSKIIPHHPEKNTSSLSTSKNKKADKQDDSSQALFDYVATEVPVVSISGTSETSKTSELFNRPEISKPPKPIEPINPHIFMTITEKDVDQSQEYQNRMMADAEVIKFAREKGMDLNDLFYMTRRERLISKEIYLWEFEDVGKSWEYIYNDKKWQKNVSIFQKNESVKERLDLYDVFNIPDKQVLADVMIMLCIRPAEIKNLRISNGGVTGYAKNRGQQDIPRVFRSLEKNEERARQLLTWIQEAIISRVLRDPGKSGSTYLSVFLKKKEFILKPYKLLVSSSLRKLGVVFAVVASGIRNLSKANTIASQVLRHSPDNHTAPSDRYTIVNFR
ncbi:hypothetical protein RhiirC2_795392, partial [Rhizophagus irregularis]